MEKVLVTGATGFLGEYLVRRLLNTYEVYALGRNEQKGQALAQLGAFFCCGDFTDEKQCQSYFTGMDYVIHAGALSTVWGSWQNFYQSNVQGTDVVSRLCCQNKVKRLVYLSSPSIYTEKRHRYAIKESQYHSNNHLNNYIKSKLMAEQVVHNYEAQGLETVIIRPRGLIGIGDTSLVPRLLKANEQTGIPVFNGGRNQVDLTSVENVALACELALQAPGVSGQAFNITNGEPMAFGQLLEAFLTAVEETPKYRRLPFALVYVIAAAMEWGYRWLNFSVEPPLTRYTVCTLGFTQTMDISKAKKWLGYQPQKSLKESISEYGIWWKQQKMLCGRAGTGQIETVKIHHCGCCINNLRHIWKGHRSEIRMFPAAVAVIKHKKYGMILFDTGYSDRLFHKGVWLWLYRTFNPIILRKKDVITEKLKKDGIHPHQIKRIILSHGHPDHIGGLCYFHNYQLIVTTPVLQSLRRPSLKNLVLKQLLPKKGDIHSIKELTKPEEHHFLNAYFGTVYDLLGDKSLYGVVLEGHSRGQLGLWIPDAELLLAADACWGNDLMPVVKKMGRVARQVQDDFSAYQKTVGQLERLQKDHPEIKIVFSHQQGEAGVYGRAFTGS